ncbi:hypothetical protein [Moraxella lacunata]|uniref:hypothetical protein n=1 Tax=Moraxella lacunata TaxID=477 RepID=UPI003EE1B1FD
MDNCTTVRTPAMMSVPVKLSRRYADTPIVISSKVLAKAMSVRVSVIAIMYKLLI